MQVLFLTGSVTTTVPSPPPLPGIKVVVVVVVAALVVAVVVGVSRCFLSTANNMRVILAHIT